MFNILVIVAMSAALAGQVRSMIYRYLSLAHNTIRCVNTANTRIEPNSQVYFYVHGCILPTALHCMTL